MSFQLWTNWLRQVVVNSLISSDANSSTPLFLYTSSDCHTSPPYTSTIFFSFFALSDLRVLMGAASKPTFAYFWSQSRLRLQTADPECILEQSRAPASLCLTTNHLPVYSACVTNNQSRRSLHWGHIFNFPAGSCRWELWRRLQEFVVNSNFTRFNALKNLSDMAVHKTSMPQCLGYEELILYKRWHA